MTNASSAIGLVLIVLYAVVAIMGAVGATPYSSDRPSRDRLQPPSAAHWMGTDMLGRDVASRIMKGATNSMRVAAVSVVLSGIIGTLLGVLAGYIGGFVDSLIMRSSDVIFAFPALLLALLVIAVMGPGLNSAIIAITIVYTPIFARVARGPVLSLKAVEYVTAARCIGARHFSILFRHILPNMTAPLIVQFSLALSWALLTETSLSFIGLGTQPPDASWGVMLNESRAIADRAPWLIFFSGAAIVLSVLGFSLLGDGLRDVLDPKMRKRA
jgi:peptide/nickel transport system permease protein